MIWEGYFKWDWNKKELYFQNGDYYLNEELIREMGLDLRTDWYYIKIPGLSFNR